MNQQELRAFLDSAGVPRGWYRLDEERSSWEETCLAKVGDEWEVFFTERGDRVVHGRYETEDDACQFMAEYMVRTLSESSPVPPEVMGTSGT